MNDDIAHIVVAMTAELRDLRGRSDYVANARRDHLYEQLRLVGMTAAFFGGYGAMKRLHDAAEDLVGNTNEVGYIINRAWDMVGGWLA